MDIPSSCAPILTFSFSNRENANSNPISDTTCTIFLHYKGNHAQYNQNLVPTTHHNIIAQLDGSWPVSNTEAHVILDTGGLYILFHLVFKHIMLPLAIIFTRPENLKSLCISTSSQTVTSFLLAENYKFAANMKYRTMERTTYSSEGHQQGN